MAGEDAWNSIRLGECRNGDHLSSPAKSQSFGASIGQAENRANIQQTGIPGQQEHKKSIPDALLSPVKNDGFVPHQLKISKCRKENLLKSLMFASIEGSSQVIKKYQVFYKFTSTAFKPY